MRNARLQNQDLARTSQFINLLLSKEDVKNQDKPEAPEPPKVPQVTNGNVSFRSDGGKTRFSEPPAPPPSQPLPEKPDISRPISSEIPALKRGTTERPKSHPTNTSPIHPNNTSLNQIMQLTEALNNAKKELDAHTARVRDLEEMLNKEREARLLAEDLMQKMEESNHAGVNGSAVTPLVNGHSELDKAFDLPAEQPPTPDQASTESAEINTITQPDKTEAMAAAFQARIDAMASEMVGLKEQLEAFRLRAEKAEAERDADRQTLAEMVQAIRQREEDEKRVAERKSRSPSKGRTQPVSRGRVAEKDAAMPNGTPTAPADQHDGPADESTGVPTLSRANTITPASRALASPPQDPAIIQTLPYASMISVVLIGMGLMAYLNGWQPQPKLDH